MFTVVMHYAGFPCDMDTICELAIRHRLKLIEDACHGPLSEYKGRKLGTFGDVGCFSFFSNKNISTGEGGMIVTNNEEYYAKMKLLRSHGMTSLSYERSEGHSASYDVVALGYNYRMDDIHASIGIAQLGKLNRDLLARKRIREKYLQLLTNCEFLNVPFADHREFVSNYIFPVLLGFDSVEKRDKVRIELHRKGIQTSVHYPSVHRFSIYKDFAKSLKKTEYVSDNEITLPMYARLSDEELIFIAETLKGSVMAHAASNAREL
jgi:dTDP-4-amino-4,6-dideoxygalactose transaminase